MFEKTKASTPPSASITSCSRAVWEPARACIASRAPAKPSTRPISCRLVSGSPRSEGASSARISGLELAMMDPMPAERCRSATYVIPRHRAFPPRPNTNSTTQGPRERPKPGPAVAGDGQPQCGGNGEEDAAGEKEPNGEDAERRRAACEHAARHDSGGPEENVENACGPPQRPPRG